jgi:hypothetical protein
MSDDKPKPLPMDHELPPAYGEAAFDASSAAAPPRPGRGCLFYGCATVAGLALLAMIAVGASLYYLNRAARQLVASYTAPAPVPIPVVELPKTEKEALTQRMEAFETAAEAGQPDSITLTAEQVNALIADDDDLRGKVAIEIPNDTIKARVSLPLGDLGLPEFIAGGLSGRYLNGTATLEPAIVGHTLRLNVRDIEAAGRKVDPAFIERLQEDGALEIKLGDAHNGKADAMRNIDRVEVRDGTITLTVRPSAAGTPPPAMENRPDPAP